MGEVRLTVDCGILRTDDSDEARAHNAAWLDNSEWPALGIEVTDPNLARRCILGNIDPQHKEGGRSSAIEEMMSAVIPAMEQFTCVTIRLDRDALGAMAILFARILGREKDILRVLVAWLGALDQMGFHNAKEAHPRLFAEVNSNPYMSSAVQALNVISNNHDKWPQVNDKVREFLSILCGDATPEDLDEYLRHRPVRVNSDFSCRVETYGDVAFIEAPGEYDAARDWLNRHYPVGVVFDPRRITQSGGTQARWSVIRQVNPKKVFDRYGFEAAINATEAKARGLTLGELAAKSLTWGGPSNIITSPQGEGRGTFIPPKQILELVHKHLESGIVT